MSPFPVRMEDHWRAELDADPGRARLMWLMLLGDCPQVAEVARLGQARLAGLDGLDLVPRQWLHMTTLIAGFAAEITPSQVGVMAGEARRLLARRPPVTLAHLARRLGRPAVVSSDSYATVPLGGFSRNWLASAFAETMDALGGAVKTFVILDGDLRCQEAVDIETRDLRKAGAQVHVWSRRELENYLLVASAITKVTGIPRADAEELLTEILGEQKDEALLALESQRLDEHKLKIGGAAKLAHKTVLENARAEFRTRWATLAGQVGIVDAKVTIRKLNSRLQSRNAKTVNMHSLARSIPPSDIPSEVQDVIRKLEAFIKGP